MGMMENVISWNLGDDVITMSFVPEKNTEVIERVQEILLANYHLPSHPCKIQETMR